MGIKRILVVDDNDADLSLIKRFLENEPYLIEKAGSAIAALEMLKTVSYDLILIDVMMPDVSGLEMIEMLKEKNVKGKIAVMSGGLTDSVLSLLEDLGIEDIYTKSDASESLVSFLKKVV